MTDFWATYPASYRAREMKNMARWISAGESGSVVGLPGVGQSNLLGFLCHRPEVLQSYLLPQTRPVTLIQVDLNRLPANNLSTLYRVLLRSFYRVRDQFDASLQQKITELFLENRSERDPFLAQSALQELLLLCQAQQIQVVLVFDGFDRFCQLTTPHVVNTLRGLRDDFKDTLCFIAGMSQEVAYLPDPTILGDMYALLDNYICWIGAMGDSDGRHVIGRATQVAAVPPSEADTRGMLNLTGGYPALLRAACSWWLTTVERPVPDDWSAVLLAERSIQHRLAIIWTGLTQEEQFTLSELQKLQTAAAELANQGRKANRKQVKAHGKAWQHFNDQHGETLPCLGEKGICARTEEGWRISIELMVGYIAQVEGRGRGRIWLEEKTGAVYQGQSLVQGLTALESGVLSFFVQYPRIRHTKTDVIFNTWPDELRQQGVTDNSLYQVVLTLRRAIEPTPSQPRYLVTWRGKPEGGYQFFPEGRPG
jgi:hypothetical protein